MLLGNYSGTPSRYTTPLKGISEKAGPNTEVVYEPGCNLVDEGPILKPISPEMVSVDGKPGLKMEFFKGTEPDGEPVYSEINSMGNANWLAFGRIPGLERGSKYAIRWTGKLTVPVSGDIEFTVSGNGGYRLFVDGNPVVEDWTDHAAVTTFSNHLRLEKDKSYDLRAEFFQTSGFPMLSVQWDIFNTDHFKKAVELARSSDVVIFVGGITARLEGEEMRVTYDGFKGGDRTKISLPKVQEDLIKALNATGKPVVLVLTSGSALGVVWENENIPAIVQLWYPGEEGGTALADVLFGDCNPSGRLPVTFYKSVDQLPPFDDYNMKGRTYRFFEGNPLYAFGFGLSYTRFKYSELELPDEIKTGDEMTVSVKVKNSGTTEGQEVVQLYVKNIGAAVPVPIHSLEGIKKVNLKPGEEKTVEFVLTPKQMAVFSDEGNFVVRPGMVEISVGGGQPGFIPETSSVLTGKVEVNGSPFLLD
jgi:beta-glucosidase